MAGVDGPSHGYYLAQSTNSTGVVIEMSGLSPMAVFAGSSMLFTMLAVMLHCLLECGFYDSFSELLVRLCRSIEACTASDAPYRRWHRRQHGIHHHDLAATWRGRARD